VILAAGMGVYAAQHSLYGGQQAQLPQQDGSDERMVKEAIIL